MSGSDENARQSRRTHRRFDKEVDEVVLSAGSTPPSSASTSASRSSLSSNPPAKRRRFYRGSDSNEHESSSNAGEVNSHSSASEGEVNSNEEQSSGEGYSSHRSGQSNPRDSHHSSEAEAGADEDELYVEHDQINIHGEDDINPSPPHSPVPSEAIVSDDEVTSDDNSDREQSEASSDSSDTSDEEIDDIDGARPDQEALYEGAPLSVGESFVAILTLAITHSLTGVCIADLLKLIALHCPQPNKCATTYYKFIKHFSDFGKKSLVLHYFCEECYTPLNSKDDLCERCQVTSVSYFIEIPLLSQLQKMFKRPGFFNALSYRNTRVKEGPEHIEDVYDGQLYKQEIENGFLNNPANLTFMWYSDGISIFRSSTFSLWPLCYVINELPYKMRTQKDNIILAGLWFGKSKPKVNLFLEPFFQKMREFKNNGILFEVAGHEDPVLVRGKVLLGTCDLQAKSLFCRAKASNGFYGCLKCKSRGERERIGPRSSVHIHRYLPNEMPLRTNEEVPLFSRLAVQHQGSCYGIKGPSVLYELMDNMIIGTGIDIMHGIFIGTFKLLMALWFTQSFSFQAFSLYAMIHVVDERLSHIKPPGFVKKVPRSIYKCFKLWKASEFKLFFFYYAVPVLYGLWGDNHRYFNHFVKLVSATYLLSQRSIHPDQVTSAGNLLREFVSEFEVLYGRRYLTMNVHQLIHLEQCVRDLGPLWVYSCFFLEDLNGGLSRLVHGTQYVGLQICSSASLFMSLSTIIGDMNPESAVRVYCEKIRAKAAQRLKVAEEVTPVLKVLGLYKYGVNAEDINVISRRFRLANGKYQYFSRITNHSKPIFSVALNPRVIKTSSVHVMVNLNQVPLLCKVLKFIRWSACNCNAVCLCQPARFFGIVQVYDRIPYFIQNIPGARMMYMNKVSLTDRILCVDILSEIDFPCFFVKVDDDEYLSAPVNLLEIE